LAKLEKESQRQCQYNATHTRTCTRLANEPLIEERGDDKLHLPPPKVHRVLGDGKEMRKRRHVAWGGKREEEEGEDESDKIRTMKLCCHAPWHAERRYRQAEVVKFRS
jgi:hypothetical protein